MGRRGDTMTAKLLELAKEHGGAFVKHEDVLRVVFNLTPNGKGGAYLFDGTAPHVAKARRKMYDAIHALKGRGLIRCKRGAFAVASTSSPVAPVEELPPDVEEAAPLPASTRVERRLNRLAMMVNELHEEVSELRHDLRVRDTVEEARPSFPMRCSWPGERDD